MKRRDLLRRALGVVAAPLVTPGRGPAALVLADAARPSTEWGASVGDVTGGRALVWSRTDRPSRLVVEYATTEAFRDPRRVVGPAALEDAGFTARVDLADLPAGQRIFYRALFQDLTDLRTWSLPATGSFRTPPPTSAGRELRVGRRRGGPGMGDQPRVGRPAHVRDDAARGARLLRPQRGHDLRRQPAAARGEARRRLRSGRTSSPPRSRRSRRRSTSSAATSSTTSTTRTCAASTPRCRWSRSGTTTRCATTGFPPQVLDDPRYQVKSVALLAARAKKAFLEYMPIRLPGRGPRAGLPQDRLRPEPRRVRPRHAQLPRPQLGESADLVDRGIGLPRRGAARLARARARRLARHLEGDRQRHADRARDHGRSRGLRGGRERGRAAPRTRARDRPPPGRAAESPGQERRLDHRRRPLRRGPSLRPPRGRASPTSIPSGSSWPVPCTRAPSARTRSTTPSAPKCASAASPRA